MTAFKITSGVWRAGTRYVNWYLIDAGEDGVTVVDAGLPGYQRHLDESLHQIGRRRDGVRAVLLTHGHIDHTGMAAALAGYGACRTPSGRYLPAVAGSAASQTPPPPPTTTPTCTKPAS